MEGFNFYILLIAAVIPLVVGAVYYNDNVFGKTWMKVSGVTAEQIQSGNMLLIFGLSYLFGLFISFTMVGLSVHQSVISSIFTGAENYGLSAAESETLINEFLDKYGAFHRSFKHGVIHGIIATIFFAFPIIAINSLFERRGWKYIWIHSGYWLITLVLMGGVICAFL
jgi:hypothetical protein